MAPKTPTKVAVVLPRQPLITVGHTHVPPPTIALPLAAFLPEVATVAETATDFAGEYIAQLGEAATGAIADRFSKRRRTRRNGKSLVTRTGSLGPPGSRKQPTVVHVHNPVFGPPRPKRMPVRRRRSAPARRRRRTPYYRRRRGKSGKFRNFGIVGNRRRRKMRRGRKARVPLPYGMPKSMLCRFKVVHTALVNSTQGVDRLPSVNGTFTSRPIDPRNPIDPFRSYDDTNKRIRAEADTHRVNGWAQMQAMYQSYAVVECRAAFSFPLHGDNEADNAWGGVVVRDKIWAQDRENKTWEHVNERRMLPRNRHRMGLDPGGPSGKQSQMLTGVYNWKKYHGTRKGVDYEKLWNLTTIEASDVLYTDALGKLNKPYIHVWNCGEPMANVANVYVTIEIDYVVAFKNPHNIADVLAPA